MRMTPNLKNTLFLLEFQLKKLNFLLSMEQQRNYKSK
jgi:hypothetical protein